jgi:hypothetical protein
MSFSQMPMLAPRARRVALERDGQVDPDQRAILADEALLQRVTRLLAPHERDELLEAGGQIIRMRDLLPGLLEQLLAGVADDLAELLVDAQEAALEVTMSDADRNALPPGILRSSAVQQNRHLVGGDAE